MGSASRLDVEALGQEEALMMTAVAILGAVEVFLLVSPDARAAHAQTMTMSVISFALVMKLEMVNVLLAATRALDVMIVATVTSLHFKASKTYTSASQKQSAALAGVGMKTTDARIVSAAQTEAAASLIARHVFQLLRHCQNPLNPPVKRENLVL